MKRHFHHWWSKAGKTCFSETTVWWSDFGKLLPYDFFQVKLASESDSALKTLEKYYLPPFLPIYCYRILSVLNFDPHDGRSNFLFKKFKKSHFVPHPQRNDNRPGEFKKKASLWTGLLPALLKKERGKQLNRSYQITGISLKGWSPDRV